MELHVDAGVEQHPAQRPAALEELPLHEGRQRHAEPGQEIEQSVGL
jgi:hypothetical protein